MTHDSSQTLRIGTRGSLLALAQTDLCVQKLCAAFPELKIETVVLKVSGDYQPGCIDERLVDKGGKGLFTKELEAALLDKRIDVAVHSMKDVPTWLPQGLGIAAVLPRVDARDAFISLRYEALEALPQGAVIGTSSLRRQAQLLALYPHVKILPFRGNVDTRLKKLEAGQVDATLLAYAGLQRMGKTEYAKNIIDEKVILPAVAQGVVGLQIRTADEGLAEKLAAINCTASMLAMQAERAMLEVLDGSCHTPIAGLATLANGRLFLKGLVAHPDGKGVWRFEQAAPLADALRLGKDVGRALRRLVPSGILPE